MELTPLLIVDGDDVRDGDALSDVTVSARILAHERGPKLRVVKFKPKRGYKRHAGHRQELTKIEISSLGGGSRKRSAKTAAPVAASDTAEAGNGS